MTEPTPDTTAPETDQAAQPEPAAEQTDSTDWKAEARKWEQRAKDNQKAARDLEAQRKASMTEAERAIAEAREQAAIELRTQYGSRLARTEYIAAAAKRNPSFDASAVLEDINLAKFIGEDGEPDLKAIATSVARLIPEANSGAPQPPSFDGGTRSAAPAGRSMNDLIRQAAGRQ